MLWDVLSAYLKSSLLENLRALCLYGHIRWASEEIALYCGFAALRTHTFSVRLGVRRWLWRHTNQSQVVVSGLGGFFGNAGSLAGFLSVCFQWVPWATIFDSLPSSHVQFLTFNLLASVLRNSIHLPFKKYLFIWLPWVLVAAHGIAYPCCFMQDI